jgi:hypothetical protein
MTGRRAVFLSGAIFNLAVGSGLIFLFSVIQPYLGMAAVPAALMFLVDLVGMFICAFGFAYWLLSVDFQRYRPFASFGAVCKLLVVGIVVAHFLAGHVGWQLLALAMVDLVYAILFLVILREAEAGAIQTA